MAINPCSARLFSLSVNLLIMFLIISLVLKIFRLFVRATIQKIFNLLSYKPESFF